MFKLKPFKKGNALSYIVVVLAVMGLSVSLMSNITPGKNNVLQDSNENLKLLNQLTEQQAQRVANDIQGDTVLFDLSSSVSSYVWDKSTTPCVGTDANFKNFYYTKVNTTAQVTGSLCQYNSSEVDNELSAPLSGSALSVLQGLDSQALQSSNSITVRGQNMTIGFKLKDSTGAPGLKRLLKSSSDTLSFGEPGNDAIAVTVEGHIDGTNQVVYKTIVVNRPADPTCGGNINSSFALDTANKKTLPNTYPLQVGAVYGNYVQLGPQQFCPTYQTYGTIGTPTQSSIGACVTIPAASPSYELYLLNAVRYNDTDSTGANAKQAQAMVYFLKTGATEGYLFFYATKPGSTSLDTNSNPLYMTNLPAGINMNNISQYIKTQFFTPSHFGSTPYLGRVAVVYATSTGLKPVTLSWHFAGASATDNLSFTTATTPTFVSYSSSTDRMDFNSRTKTLTVATMSDKKVRFYAYDANGIASSTVAVTPALGGAPTSFTSLLTGDNAPFNTAILTGSNGTSSLIYSIDKTSSTAATASAPTTNAAAVTSFYTNGTFYWLYANGTSLYMKRPGITAKTISSVDGSAIWNGGALPQVVAMDNNQLAIRTSNSVFILNNTGLYPIKTGLGDTVAIASGVGAGSIGKNIAYVEPYLYFTDTSGNKLYRFNGSYPVNANNYSALGTVLASVAPPTVPGFPPGGGFSSKAALGTGSLFAIPEQNQVYAIGASSATSFWAYPVVNTCPVGRYRSGQYANASTTNGFLPSNGTSTNFLGESIDSLNGSFSQPARSI